jgi:hypothetical protein
MSEQEQQGPKDRDSATQQAAGEDTDVDREAILARRKFLVMSALGGIALSTGACETLERFRADPTPCLSPMPCLNVANPVTPDVPSAPMIEPQPMPCLSESPNPYPSDPDAAGAMSAQPCLSLRHPPTEGAPDAGRHPMPQTCLRVSRPQPRTCLSMLPPQPVPTSCLNVLKPEAPEDEES